MKTSCIGMGMETRPDHADQRLPAVRAHVKLRKGLYLVGGLPALCGDAQRLQACRDLNVLTGLVRTIYRAVSAGECPRGSPGPIDPIDPAERAAFPGATTKGETNSRPRLSHASRA